MSRNRGFLGFDISVRAVRSRRACGCWSKYRTAPRHPIIFPWRKTTFRSVALARLLETQAHHVDSDSILDNFDTLHETNEQPK